MPRQARLDASGLLQHVMARGIERRKIFKDDKDRASFLNRLGLILEETQTQCYAWALIPNHFHLLLRTGLTPISSVMRRLMTGYAVTFNIRHRRSGHLFQNRYKSIVCEEETYLLELTRYIHLNPVRAKLVNDLKELDKYSWTGHSILLGKRKNLLIPQPDKPNKSNDFNDQNELKAPNGTLAEKTVEDVLKHFGNNFKDARQKYREFVEKGIKKGGRPELQGGGLVRSAGGDTSVLCCPRSEDRELSDQRILGSGDFVAGVLKEANELEERRVKNRISLNELIERVAKDFKIDIKELVSSKRNQKISHARAIISYLAVIELKYTGTRVAKALGLSGKSVSRCIGKGKNIIESDQGLLDFIK
ncbi:MAG: transposase [Deltaproteobacteria bacterium]|nr:transposase [Deltaproteobacteria bacterium]